MSISDRVADAIDGMAQGNTEGALISICPAIDATASKHYNKRGKQSYKRFVRENLSLITKAAFGGATFGQIRLKYAHPELPKVADDLQPIENILYHVVRCGLLHTAELPDTLTFVVENRFRVDDGMLVLPASLVVGFVVAVIACPANSDQTTDESYQLNVGGQSIPVNNLWGKRDAVLAIHEMT